MIFFIHKALMCCTFQTPHQKPSLHSFFLLYVGVFLSSRVTCSATCGQLTQLTLSFSLLPS